MSSHIRNTLRAGAIAFALGATAIALTTGQASAASFGHIGGFGGLGRTSGFSGLGHTGGLSTLGHAGSLSGVGHTGTFSSVGHTGTFGSVGHTGSVPQVSGPRNTTDIANIGRGLGDDNFAGGLYNQRAFMEWAGLTAGITESFYDYYSVPAAMYQTVQPSGDPGWWTYPYTTQLGNGVTATQGQ